MKFKRGDKIKRKREWLETSIKFTNPNRIFTVIDLSRENSNRLVIKELSGYWDEERFELVRNKKSHLPVWF